MKCCPKCKTEKSVPLKNENGDNVFWVASYKNTEDFCILLSDQEDTTFIASLEENYPTDNDTLYDYYCTNCFLEIAQRDKYYSVDNE